MSRRRRMPQLLVAGLVTGVLVLIGPLRADGAVITSFVGLLQAAAGQGWAPHPDQTAGGTEQFVTGPAPPPAGTGSLQMTAATTADRALVFTVPNPGTGATPPGSEGPFNPVAWGST